MSLYFNGSLRASVLPLIILFSALSNAQPFLDIPEFTKVASSNQWLALLHVKDGEPIIKDPNFILSIHDFNPQQELLKTIEFLSKEENLINQQACRFIARAEFIQKNLGLNLKFEDAKCLEYQTFLSKAPVDQVSIIYASENLTQPSSMLGHSMLAISGESDFGFVEHGVSFFTELDSINLASILWDTLYVGKKGYFVIEPLSKSVNYYSQMEQRNIWQYELNFNKYERMLLHKHLWELRGLDIDYFFHKHNCATLSFDILAVARPDLSNYRQSWVTPIDVVKSAENSEIIKSTQIYPSSKWRIRMLTDFLTDDELLEIEQMVVNDEANNIDSVLSKEMVIAYNQYNLEIGSIDKIRWEDNYKKWSLDTNRNYFIEMTHYKSPIDAMGDAAYHLSIESSSNKKWLLAGWLPTSHSIEDDNKRFFGETELKLSEVVVKVSLDDSSISLYRWPVYTAASLTPRNRLTGGLSGRFSFGFDQFLHDEETELAGYITGALGVTYKISRDVSAYYLGHIGQVANINNSYAYLSPEIGVYVYEVFNMKSMISLKREYRTNSEKINYLTLKQSLYFDNNALVVNANFAEGSSIDYWKVGLQYKIYF